VAYLKSSTIKEINMLYVVRGPKQVTEERKETLRVDEADATMQPYGTPVVCHGLKNSYYNGKIGEIRSIDKTATR
jgi:hypothetical protein